MASDKKISQKETAMRLQQQTYTLEKQLGQKLYSIEEIGEIIPGVVLIDDFIQKSNDYMNNAGCNVLRHTSEELNLMGDKYFTEFFVPSEISQIFRMARELILSGDGSRVNCFYQRLRPDQDSPFEWYHMTTKLFTEGEKDSGLFRKMIMVGTKVTDMNINSNKFNRILEENEFAARNYHRFSRLTKREKEILALLAQGYRVKDIAEKLFVSESTVNQHRKNIGHKLEIKNVTQIVKYALAFDLI
ncbi:response regulator transcription factor [Adhaeribacter soli]|uniref:Helix-turn-helix transcriptional regulator n=1 Tax=Adhaeribacter soli TaxID=2607655 RepID=A0A5N1J496_9BACT|nr:helix-turn-helix transcriptional regulator [Adhaeribacter soli]KAA9340905.1 helix-turn-helix transcriptional regulator [Adhaeribacter soli]